MLEQALLETISKLKSETHRHNLTGADQFMSITMRLPRRMGNTTIGLKVASYYKSLYVVPNEVSIELLNNYTIGPDTKVICASNLKNSLMEATYDLIVFDCVDARYLYYHITPGTIILKVGTDDVG
jgi:hypothetical protein